MSQRDKFADQQHLVSSCYVVSIWRLVTEVRKSSDAKEWKRTTSLMLGKARKEFYHSFSSFKDFVSKFQNLSDYLHKKILLHHPIALKHLYLASPELNKNFSSVLLPVYTTSGHYDVILVVTRQELTIDYTSCSSFNNAGRSEPKR